MTHTFKQAKRLVTFVVGATVLLLGIVMVVAPGPGLLTIALGLGILASEFLWARRLLKRLRTVGKRLAGRLLGKYSFGLIERLGGVVDWGRARRRRCTFGVR
jgi:tellurite resistance protein TerC/cation:H+ antiporter